MIYFDLKASFILTKESFDLYDVIDDFFKNSTDKIFLKNSEIGTTIEEFNVTGNHCC
jgi:hypothetical protein